MSRPAFPITMGLLIVAGLCALCAAKSPHAAGWVLMRPHLDGIEARIEEPIYTWEVTGAFDSALECIEELLLLRALIYDHELDALPQDSNAWAAAAGAVAAARCVPAEYVRRGSRHREPQTDSQGDDSGSTEPA